MHLSRNQADVIAPGVWITFLLILGLLISLQAEHEV